MDAPPAPSRRSAVVGQETAAVEPADAEPSPQPLQERTAAPPAVSQPADSQPADPQPSTAPTGGDERVDVVIVVRRSDSDPAARLAPAAAASAAPAPADAEPAGPIEKHEILTVTLTPEGVDAAADADGANVENVRVAEDGTIDLPSVGRIQAEGRTSAELAEEITTARKRNNAPAGVRVKVTRVGGPATQQAPPPGVQPADPSQP